MPIFIGGVPHDVFIGTVKQDVYIGTQLVSGAGGEDLRPPWDATRWTGSVTGVSQSGVVTQSAGNGVITITSQFPSGENTNSGDRDVTVNYSVSPATPGDYNPATAFSASPTFSQPGVGYTYAYSGYTPSGSVYGGAVTTVNGEWSAYFPTDGPANESHLNQQRSRSVVETTAATFQDQVQTCQRSDGATVFDSASTCGLSQSLTNTATISGQTVNSFTETQDNPNNPVPNPAYRAPFTFADISSEVSNQVSVSSDGEIVGLGDYESSYLNGPALEGSNLEFNIALAPDSQQPDSAFQDATNDFPGLDFDDNDASRSIRVIVTGDNPFGYQDAGSEFSLAGNVSETQFAPDPDPPKINSVTVRWTDADGNSQSQTISNDDGSVNVYRENGYNVDVNLAVSSGVTNTWSPPGTTVDFNTEKFKLTGTAGRAHRVTASNGEVPDDTFSFHVYGVYSGGDTEAP